MGDGLEGRALDDLLHQLAGAVHGGFLTADSGRLDIDFADQILGLGGRVIETTDFLIDLKRAGTRAAVEATGHQLSPADLGAQALAESVRLDAALLKELHIGGGGDAGLARHLGDFLVDLLVGDFQAFELGDLLGLQALLNQPVEGGLLDRRQVLLGRLDLRRGDQHEHLLTQIESRDDLVVHRGDDAVGHLELGGGASRCGTVAGRRIRRSGGGRLRSGRSGRRLTMSRTGEEDRRERSPRRITHQTHWSS